MNPALTAKQAAMWRALLPVMDAFAQGEEVQFKNEAGNWVDTNLPGWSLSYSYRIKPKPAVMYVIQVYSSARNEWICPASSYLDMQDRKCVENKIKSLMKANPCSEYRIKEFVEVLDEHR